MNLGTFGKALGLLAGLATLVYIAGGVVLTLRLGFEDLPGDNVIAQLPREFLISVGVTIVVAPIALAAMVYAAWRLTKGGGGGFSDIAALSQPEVKASRAGKAALIGAALVIPGGVWSLIEEGWRWELFLWLGIAWLISAGWAYAMLELRAVIVRRHATTASPPMPRPSWFAPATVGTMSLFYAALLLPAAIVVGVVVPMTDVSACTLGGAKITGTFVGDTSERLYIGVPEPDDGPGKGSRRIISLPYSSLGEVYLGDNAYVERCYRKLQPPARTS